MGRPAAIAACSTKSPFICMHTRAAISSGASREHLHRQRAQPAQSVLPRRPGQVARQGHPPLVSTCRGTLRSRRPWRHSRRPRPGVWEAGLPSIHSSPRTRRLQSASPRHPTSHTTRRGQMYQGVWSWSPSINTIRGSRLCSAGGTYQKLPSPVRNTHSTAQPCHSIWQEETGQKIAATRSSVPRRMRPPLTRLFIRMVQRLSLPRPERPPEHSPGWNPGVTEREKTI